jgi:hypothetical protein
MKKYLISFVAAPHWTEADREYHEVEITSMATPGTFGFWLLIHDMFPGTTEKLEWVEL